jgi:muramoyltetrapeptide carboxypeptidase
MIKRKICFGIVAPAGPVRDLGVLDKALDRMRVLGWEYKEGATLRGGSHGFLSASDAERFREIQVMLFDKDVTHLWCVRGGYGCARILPEFCKLLKDVAAANNQLKPIIGFSDVTALHCGVLSTGFLNKAYHAPMVLSLLGREEVDEYSMSQFKNCIYDEASITCFEKVEVWSDGKAKGPLIGGNLTVLLSLLGTPFFPDLRGCVLFLEDIGESAYRIDRMLTQLKLSSEIYKVSGVILGDFTTTDVTCGIGSVRNVLESFFLPLGIPVIHGAPIGHEKSNTTLPVGQVGTLSTEKKSLTYLSF